MNKQELINDIREFAKNKNSLATLRNKLGYEILVNLQEIGFDNEPFRLFFDLLEKEYKIAYNNWLNIVSNQQITFSAKQNKFSIKPRNNEKSFVIDWDMLKQYPNFTDRLPDKEPKSKPARTKESLIASLQKVIQKYNSEYEFTEQEIFNTIKTYIGYEIIKKYVESVEIDIASKQTESNKKVNKKSK